MTLTEQIEALRTKMNAAAGDELALTKDLAAELFAHDKSLMREIEAMLTGHQRRRGDILAALDRLAARIGYLPRRTAYPAAQGIYSEARSQIESVRAPSGVH